jgi:thiol reductant ABC exporter CydD subunit
VVIGTLIAVLAVIQAFTLARIITEVFQGGAGLAAVMGSVWLLVGVVLARVVLAYLSEVSANASAAEAKSQLRLALVDKVMRLGPVWAAGRGEGELANLSTRGINALDAYFARYLPMLVLAVTIPVVGGIAVLTQDVLAFVIIVLTLPLIPMFMILVGLYTKSKVDRQWRTLGVLSGHFLDVVAGLPTLAVFGRAKAQAENIQRVGDAYRVSTLKVLRVSFLSSLVLELLASLSVAIIAVSIGLRLVGGSFTLEAGLAVLILAPEIYLPLRLVGANFHAAAEGLGAAEQVFDVLETPEPEAGTVLSVKSPGTSPIVFDSVTLTYPDRSDPAVSQASLRIEPGVITALVGPSGCGKSTLLNVLMRFVNPDDGTITVGGDSLFDYDADAWRSRIGYVPQRPYLLSMSLADNVRLGRADATDAQVWQALKDAGAEQFVHDLPAGVDTLLGEGGRTLSVGQQRRIALARALLRDAELLLLDEPTAALDEATEADILRAVRAYSQGRTVVVVAHRQSLEELADRVIDVSTVQSRSHV